MVNLRLFDRTVFSVFALVTSVYARQLAAVTQRAHQVVVPETYKEIDFSGRYDAVHLHFKTATTLKAYYLADQFRNRGIRVIMSGAHPSALPEEALLHADCVLVGNAEFLWPRVVTDLEQGNLQSRYEVSEGAHQDFRSNNAVMPAQALKLFGVIEASRGCPYKCDFCQDANVVSGAVFRKRNVSEVIAEMKQMPQRLVFFCDVSLTIDPVFTKELLREMKGLGKRFVCEGNVDVLARDEELVSLSAEAGCIEWTVGFESFFQDTLLSVHKKTNSIADYQEVVDRIHRYDMAILGNFMFGFDADSAEVFAYTRDKVFSLGLDSARFSIVTPYPGTPLFDRLEKEGRILTHDWSKYNRKTVVFQPNNMSGEELQQGYNQVVKEFNQMESLIQRCLHSVRLGVYPLMATIGRNVESYLNRPATT
ncbi:MAG: radical SAM protein [Candidatus Thermoplasmatota archaeon]|nr:radical SAM protein [Candidatus Thermoplasmatota archaeon]MBU1941266.1 radical SAM protein [Candidatus Thermoplasmatota archaeon]